MSVFLEHYFSMPGFLYFLLISTAFTFVIHQILWMAAKYIKKGDSDLYETYKEEYYELIFASTSTLFFSGIFFLFDLRRIDVSDQVYAFWNKYDDFILLALLIISIILINIFDRIIIPLRKITASSMGALRMASMIYMLIIFAYIKFIYEDNNYDSIVIYFITMLIGRFVYMDASFKGFRQACSDFVKTLPVLFFVLLSTAFLALYGFKSGYLLKSNGVVVSLVIAHLFVIAEIFIIVFITRQIRRHKNKKLIKNNKKNEPIQL